MLKQLLFGNIKGGGAPCKCYSVLPKQIIQYPYPICLNVLYQYFYYLSMQRNIAEQTQDTLVELCRTKRFHPVKSMYFSGNVELINIRQMRSKLRFLY